MKLNRIAMLSPLMMMLMMIVMIASISFAQPARTTRPVTRQDSSGNQTISAAELKARLDKHEKTTVIDARGSLSGEMLKGAIHVPLSDLNEWAKTADKKSFIVTYCTCPHDEAAESAVSTLRGLGFTNVFSLKGGLNAARSAGIELVPAED